MLNTTRISSALLLASALLWSCSDVEDLANVSNPVETEAAEGMAFVKFRLQSNQSSSTRSVEDSHTYVQGTADEYKVNTARVYLYDAPTKLFVKTFLLSNITRKGSDSSGNIIYETDKVEVPQGTYDIFVTANTDRVINKDTESEFLADIDSVTYTKASIEDISAGVIMSNRGSANVGTAIANKGTDEDNLVTITLERVLARLDVAKSADEYKLTDNGGVQYATIKLDGFYIANLAKYYYSYRHTAELTSMTEPQWNSLAYFGNVADVNGYVVDPYFFKKKVDASSFTNQDKYYEHFYGDLSNPNSAQWVAFNPVNATPDYKTTYCLENCALAPAQKNGYSTGVIFRATVEPYSNVYKLNASNALELITNTAQYPEVLYYYDYKFFASPEALAAYINSIGGSGDYQTRKFENTDDGYRCYYKYWIRHLDNYRPTEMGVMEFAIVRNNLYRMLVTNVSDLGEGGTGTITVSPDIPDEGETILQVTINVKPWIVRDQTNIVL